MIRGNRPIHRRLCQTHVHPAQNGAVIPDPFRFEQSRPEIGFRLKIPVRSSFRQRTGFGLRIGVGFEPVICHRCNTVQTTPAVHLVRHVDGIKNRIDLVAQTHGMDVIRHRIVDVRIEIRQRNGSIGRCTDMHDLPLCQSAPVLIVLPEFQRPRAVVVHDHHHVLRTDSGPENRSRQASQG